MDAGAFQSCASPKQYFLLSEGQHTFQVRAKDASGNMDESPAEHTWTVDSVSPKVAFTEKPEAVTNDRTPSWAWTVEDANHNPERDYCRLYEASGNYRTLFEGYGCSSPLEFGAELPDGDYGFWIQAEDKAYNYGYSKTQYFEIDNVAPTVVSTAPTGSRVSPYATIKVAFDDHLYGPAKFVKIYKRGSNTPLAVYSYGGRNDNEVELDPKTSLKRDTRYTVKVTTGITDGANNLAAPKTWGFKTK